MRSEGLHDWQILLLIFNSVLNYRAQAAGLGTDVKRFYDFSNAFARSEESIDAPDFSEDFLIGDADGMIRKTTLGTSTKVWGLQIRSNTPDFTALKKLMDTRYGQAEDDIPHEDIFVA
jgi:hypothetical protein